MQLISMGRFPTHGLWKISIGYLVYQLVNQLHVCPVAFLGRLQVVVNTVINWVVAFS